ncbi:histone deacetylase 11-like isoform X1 [Montipora capricornis]|uniref:histone deacetylase 11-like isoform X1 n=2 Tax=Montipora foliosa TaxID=591990 RepID=UPI0035F1FBF4
MSVVNKLKKKKEGESDSTQECHLYVEMRANQWPVVYSEDYNIGFLGLERLHPFDSGKWGKVFHFLKDAKMINDESIVKPNEVTQEDLLVVHTPGYLDSLQWSARVAMICEVPPLALLPNFLVQRKVLRPMRIQTGGSILAAKLAVERGWAINIGGGFHHCSGSRGGGFCAYADITLAIKFLFKEVACVSKAMIIDLDAHQGNGHEADFDKDDQVYIMDVYNAFIYPGDIKVKSAIKKNIELFHGTDDAQYIPLLKKHIPEALDAFKPDIIAYNAGTDILMGDPLGNLSITPQGIIERDQIVFEEANKRGIPLFMLTSGGYQRRTARIIADSILNLREQGLISCNYSDSGPRGMKERTDKQTTYNTFQQ